LSRLRLNNTSLSLSLELTRTRFTIAGFDFAIWTGRFLISEINVLRQQGTMTNVGPQTKRTLHCTLCKREIKTCNSKPCSGKLQRQRERSVIQPKTTQPGGGQGNLVDIPVTPTTEQFWEAEEQLLPEKPEKIENVDKEKAEKLENIEKVGPQETQHFPEPQPQSPIKSQQQSILPQSQLPPQFPIISQQPILPQSQPPLQSPPTSQPRFRQQQLQFIPLIKTEHPLSPRQESPQKTQLHQYPGPQQVYTQQEEVFPQQENNVYDIVSNLSQLIDQQLVINESTGEPQIDLIYYLNATCRLAGKSQWVSVTGYDQHGMGVEMIVETPYQRWRLHDLRILWFDFPWEVASWPLEMRIALSQSRIPVGSSFKVRIIEISDHVMRLAPSKYASPIIKLPKSLPPSNVLCPFRYLVVMDLEATCDYCPNPRVTAKTAEIIEFPWIVIDTQSLQIIDERQIYVRPAEIEAVTMYATKLTGISKEMLAKEQNLQHAMEQFDNYVNTKLGGNSSTSQEFRIVTDGIWDLQVQLYQETEKKGIKTEWYYKEYFDLKDEFRKFLPWFPESYRPGLNDMLKALHLQFVGKPHQGIDDSRNIAQIVLRLLMLGHTFSVPKFIPPDYDPYTDPKFVDFGSVTEPDAWQCQNLSCAVWNRPWFHKCRFCPSVKNAVQYPHFSNMPIDLINT